MGYARGPGFGSFLQQEPSGCAEFSGCHFHDPRHNGQLAMEGHRLRAAQYASRNRSLMAHSMDPRRAVSCTRAHGQILAIMHVPETPGGLEEPC